MPDEHIRQLERRWRESQAAADEEAYLQALARSGRATPVGLEVAALLGHPVARQGLSSRELLSGAELAELSGVRPATVLRWGRRRGLPRRPAKESQRPIRGKFAYDPLEIVDWRLDQLAYFEDCQATLHLLLEFVHRESNDAARRLALASVWVALLTLDAPTHDPQLVERLLFKVEAALIARSDVPGFRRPDGGLTPGQELSNAQAYPLLRHATKTLGHALASSESDLLHEAFAHAFWSTVTSTMRPGEAEAYGWSGASRLGRLAKHALQRVLRQAQTEVVPWGLGGADLVADRVAQRAARPHARTAPTLADDTPGVTA